MRFYTYNTLYIIYYYNKIFLTNNKQNNPNI